MVLMILIGTGDAAARGAYYFKFVFFLGFISYFLLFLLLLARLVFLLLPTFA